MFPLADFNRFKICFTQQQKSIEYKGAHRHARTHAREGPGSRPALMDGLWFMVYGLWFMVYGLF